MHTHKAANKTSSSVSLALVAKTPATSAAGTSADVSSDLTWWIDTPTGVFRNGYDPAGKYVFTTLSTVKRPIKRIRRFFRDKIRPEPTGDELSVDFPLCPLGRASLLIFMHLCQVVF